MKQLHISDYQLYALSDNVNEIVQYLKDTYDFWGLFNHITISAEVGMMKPNQDIFKYVLEKNRLSLDETLFIDDHHPNINSAEAMGFM